MPGSPAAHTRLPRFQGEASVVVRLAGGWTASVSLIILVVVTVAATRGRPIGQAVTHDLAPHWLDIVWFALIMSLKYAASRMTPLGMLKTIFRSGVQRDAALTALALLAILILDILFIFLALGPSISYIGELSGFQPDEAVSIDLSPLWKLPAYVIVTMILMAISGEMSRRSTAAR